MLRVCRLVKEEQEQAREHEWSRSPKRLPVPDPTPWGQVGPELRIFPAVEGQRDTETTYFLIPPAKRGVSPMIHQQVCGKACEQIRVS